MLQGSEYDLLCLQGDFGKLGVDPRPAMASPRPLLPQPPELVLRGLKGHNTNSRLEIRGLRLDMGGQDTCWD